MDINQTNKKEIKDMIKENTIIGYFEIKRITDKEIIINSYENVKRENPKMKWNEIESRENEGQIKDCEIYINGKKINNNYYYHFENKGKYTIKYIFKELLKSTNFMFYGCNSLISLDLSKFNTQNVTNMGYMFYNCESLISLNILKFNTQNVTNMENMFC